MIKSELDRKLTSIIFHIDTSITLIDQAFGFFVIPFFDGHMQGLAAFQRLRSFVFLKKEEIKQKLFIIHAKHLKSFPKSRSKSLTIFFVLTFLSSLLLKG